MRYKISLAALILMALAIPAQAQVKSTPADAPTPAVEQADTDVELRGVSRRDARKLGLTIREMISIARELKSAGELTGVAEIDAEQILERAISKNPKAFADPALDWDSILAFIERILPLILTILSLF
jgi:signal transduction histidine kinase